MHNRRVMIRLYFSFSIEERCLRVKAKHEREEAFCTEEVFY